MDSSIKLGPYFEVSEPEPGVRLEELEGEPEVGAPTQEILTLSLDDLVRRAATDNNLFCQAFFPKTFRQPSAPDAWKAWDALDDPRVQLLYLKMARGWSKTTILRTWVAKRIAYGLSRTVMYVSASEPHAIRSVRWLKRQVEKNEFFTQTFGLRPGSKWQETEIEIVNAEGITTWISAFGITGGIRGVNLDDFRPDTIALDDIITDETGATFEQREKTKRLVHGALLRSLSPRTESPNAKMVLAQTPIAEGDAAQEAERSSSWKTVEITCWTPETRDLPVDEQISSWPARFPTATLRQDKKNAARDNKASVFAREMECRLVAPEDSAFKAEWLKFYDTLPPLMTGTLAVYIDPVPPPSKRSLEKGLHKRDYEAIVVAGRFGSEYYLVDYALSRGHEPNWTIAKLFELVLKWRVSKVGVETVGYQMTLKYLIEQEMKRRGVYFVIYEDDTKIKKYHKIVDTISGPASYGHFWVHPSMTDFITDFTNYASVEHDDLLDAAAGALKMLVNPYLELSAGDYSRIESNIPDLVIQERAP